MKGLLLKDYYMAIRYCRSFLLVSLVFIITSMISEGNVFTMVYPVVFCGMMAVTLIGYEERSRWTFYCEAFPYSRAQIVSSKYVFTAIVILGVIVLTAIAQGIRMSVSGTLEVLPFINLIAILFLVGCAAPAVLMPFIFKYGVEKGRMGYYIVIGAACAVGAVLTMETPDILFSISAVWLPFICLSAGMIVFGISWRMSIRFYENREL